MALYYLLQPGEGRRSYRKNYSALGTLGPAGCDVSDSSNYWHKAKKRFGGARREETGVLKRFHFAISFLSLESKEP